MKATKHQIEAELKSMYLQREEIAPDHSPELERDIKIAHNQLEVLERIDSAKLFNDAPYLQREEVAPDHDPEPEQDIKIAHNPLEALRRLDSAKLFDDAPYTMPPAESVRRGPYSI